MHGESSLMGLEQDDCGKTTTTIFSSTQEAGGGPEDEGGDGSDVSVEEGRRLERTLVRKIDWRLCSIAGILCSLNLLDSGIISSASVTTWVLPIRCDLLDGDMLMVLQDL